MLGKGLKRKRGEGEGEGEEPAWAPPPSALLSLSVAKLDRSLQRGEPDLRHLVLLASTLRRLRDALQPPPPTPTPPSPGLDAPLFSAVLEDLAGPAAFSHPLAPPRGPSPEEHGRTDQLGPPLEAGLGLGLDDGLFEDIDTSMYDSDPWDPGSKDACATAAAGTEGGLAELDYLMEVLLGAEEA